MRACEGGALDEGRDVRMVIGKGEWCEGGAFDDREEEKVVHWKREGMRRWCIGIDWVARRGEMANI